MKDTLVLNGKAFMIQSENSQYYELIEYSPDGEGTRLSVPKDECRVGEDGRLHSNRFTIEAHY
jgi:hypothetical protein